MADLGAYEVRSFQPIWTLLRIWWRHVHSIPPLTVDIQSYGLRPLGRTLQHYTVVARDISGYSDAWMLPQWQVGFLESQYPPWGSIHRGVGGGWHQFGCRRCWWRARYPFDARWHPGLHMDRVLQTRCALLPLSFDFCYIVSFTPWNGHVVSLRICIYYHANLQYNFVLCSVLFVIWTRSVQFNACWVLGECWWCAILIVLYSSTTCHMYILYLSS